MIKDGFQEGLCNLSLNILLLQVHLVCQVLVEKEVSLDLWVLQDPQG